MAIALISSTTGAGINGGTSAGIDTTGSNLIVILVSFSNGTITVSDSKSNTYTPLTTYTSLTQSERTYYCASPIVGTDHSFTVSGSVQVVNFRAAAFSGANTSPLDIVGGYTDTAASSTSADDVTFTPSEDNCLIISAHSLGASVTGYTASSGFTSLGHLDFSSGNYYGLGVVYKVQTTAAAITAATAVASWTGSAQLRTGTVSFKAAGASLASGNISLSSATNTSINLASTTASGGTPPYSYQWHRSTTANFTPGVGTAISGATSSSYSDTTAASGTVYYYKLVTTDSVPNSVTSNQSAGSLKDSTIIIGCLGDSITKGTAGPSPAAVTVTQRLAASLKHTYKNRDVTVVNGGVDGKSAQDFAANTGSIFTTAKSAFSSAGCTHIMVMLGANDAANHRSASQYLANMQTITASLVSDGYVVILNYPTYIPSGANAGATDEVATENMRSYLGQIDSLIDGTDIISGDRLAYQYFVDHMDEMQTDKTHLLDAGNISLAGMWARAFDRAVLQVTNVVSPLTAQSVTITLVNESGTAQTSLTSLKWAWYDQITPDLMLSPTSQGSVETTDSSGVLTISINTSLSSGEIGWLVVTNSDGTTTQSPAHRAFSGPVVVS